MARPSDLSMHNRRDRLDPLPELGALSARAPLAEADLTDGPTPSMGWLVTGPEEVRAVLGDTERFSTAPPADGSRPVQPGNLIQYDPPDHTRLRQLLTPEFTVRRMSRLRPAVDAVVADCLDALEKAGQSADFMRYVAWPLPGLVMSELFGVPRDDRAELARVLKVSRPAFRGRQVQMTAGAAYLSYVDQLVTRKRRDPGDDLLGRLVRDHGDDISHEELVGLTAFVIGSGVENMASMLGLGILALLENPAQLAQLRQCPHLIDQAVEELIRYLSIIPTASPRTARADVPLGGRVIKAGDRVACSLFAANRVRPPGTPPDRLDITREPAAHVGLGHGIHYCIGASLVRMELTSAYLAVLNRFPELRCAVPPEEIRFRPQAPYGVETLPVAW
ncbi:cytochrome P450 [Streptomyces avermitilis]|uniref:Cytochrome P450 n=1 Tax=Streptomyces avermitilis TaxID=33903 RepID=A0A4D4MH48_STRAX|nr:cytochrome P450 [Streptomyces avermitilis]GDY68264.1 cytochrome P450 [Streptomyces avermitilis]GDY71373.1 cytochrome P450 [Streptomyces avermitilis]